MTKPAGHTCHAHRCERVVPPRLLMCLAHWRRVPRRLQAGVWAHYRTGQEADKRPSLAYLLAARAAVLAVAAAEGYAPPATEYDGAIARMEQSAGTEVSP